MNDTDNNMAPLEEIESTDMNAVAYDDEAIVWEGRPSQWLNFGTFIWWSILLIVAGFFAILWRGGLNEGYGTLVDDVIYGNCIAVMSLAIISILYAYLSIYYEHTVITRNKIKEAKGITSIFRQELFCEISDIRDLKSPPAGLLGLFGLSTLIIETNDDDQPIIEIRAIRDREELIEKLQPIWRKLKMERKGYFSDR